MPVWVRKTVVLQAHAAQITDHGGLAGLRDEGLLDSALARPVNLYTYADKEPDLADLATAYAAGLIKNHPFLDGNKRIALIVCRTFLLLNAYTLNSPQSDRYDAIMDLASGQMSERDFAEWVRSCLVHDSL